VMIRPLTREQANAVVARERRSNVVAVPRTRRSEDHSRRPALERGRLAFH
jgi:hypothetical protein